MPSLQQHQQTPNFKECNLASDILQKHSINSLLEHDDLILSSSPHEMSPSDVDANLSFSDIFNSIGTSTPKGYNSPDSNYIQTTPPKMFDNFQFDNRSLQRNLNFDCNVTTTPTSPSTPSSFLTSPKAYMNSPSYGNDSGFYSNISRSDSPLINDSQETLSSPTFEAHRSLADIMNYLNLSQTPVQSQQQQQQQRYENQRKQDQLNAELKQLQTYQLLQQQKQLQQLNIAQPINQILQHQIIQQMNLANWRQQQQQQALNSANALDNLAKNHRSSAALYDPSCTWSGVIPPRAHRFITYSPKIFLGGLPWDLSESTLMQIFKPFGHVKVDWPGKEQSAAQPKGYVYIIFESEKQVKALLQACTIQDNFVTPPAINSNNNNNNNSMMCSNTESSNVDSNVTSVPNNGNYYYKISSRRIKEKEVEVIPWIIGDSNYIKSANQKIESAKTVFVGALHGKLTAEALAKIMNDLFDGVIYAGIDTDKYKYPIGSGRVTFNNTRSYMRAVAAAFIEIKSQKFSKKVQIDPYLEDSLCSVCGVQHGPYYCRDLSCFRYFCRSCWQLRHNNDSHLRNHKPLTRNSKSQQQMQSHYAMFNNSNGCSLSTSSGSSGSSNSSTPNDVLSSMLNFPMMK